MHWQKFHSEAHKSLVRGDRANLSLAKESTYLCKKHFFFGGIKKRKLADTNMFVRFDSATQIGFKGPKITEQFNKSAAALTTRSSVSQRSASESNQARTNTTHFNQEWGRVTDSRSLTSVLLHRWACMCGSARWKTMQNTAWCCLTPGTEAGMLHSVCYSLH